MRVPFGRPLLAPLLLMLSTPPVHAQTTEEPLAYVLGQIAVTAESPRAEQTALTTVVTADQIRATGSRTVAEALEHAAGVTVTTGRKSEPAITVNGLDQSRVVVLIDGVPYYETNYGRLDLNQIPVDAVARIEVTRGPASVLYGPNGLGGVVNIVTRRAPEESFWSVLAEGGEHGDRRYALSHAGRIGRLSLRLDLSHRATDGWELSSDFRPSTGTIVRRNPSVTETVVLEDGGVRLATDSEASAAWLKLGDEGDGDRSWFLNLHWLEQEHGMAPAVDSVTVFHKRPAFSQLGRIPLYRDRGVDLDLRQRLSPRFVIKGKVFAHDHADEYASYADLALTERLAISRFEDELTGASVIGELDAGRAGALRISVAYRDEQHRERDDTYLPFAGADSTTASLALEHQVELGSGWSAVAGVSRDRFEVTSATRNLLAADGSAVGQAALAGTRFERTAANAGVARRLAGSGRLFLSFGRATRFPTLQQLYSSKSGNVGLLPERATTAVAGVAIAPSERASLELSAFGADIEDMINRNAPTPLNRYENYAEVRILGASIVASLRASGWLTLRGDATWLEAEDRSPGRVTEEVLGVPSRTAGAAAVFTVSDRTRLDVTGSWTGRIFSTLPSPRYPSDPVRAVKPHALLGGRLGYEVVPGMELFLQGRNLLDEDYESEWAYPGPGREIRMGVTARF